MERGAARRTSKRRAAHARHRKRLRSCRSCPRSHTDSWFFGCQPALTSRLCVHAAAFGPRCAVSRRRAQQQQHPRPPPGERGSLESRSAVHGLASLYDIRLIRPLTYMACSSRFAQPCGFEAVRRYIPLAAKPRERAQGQPPKQSPPGPSSRTPSLTRRRRSRARAAPAKRTVRGSLYIYAFQKDVA